MEEYLACMERVDGSVEWVQMPHGLEGYYLALTTFYSGSSFLLSHQKVNMLLCLVCLSPQSLPEVKILL